MRLPIWLSAFGFPGLGQLAQKRWAAGAGFSVGFLIGFFWIMTIAVHNIIEFYSLAFDPVANPEPYPLGAFIAPLLLVTVIYFASLIDVCCAQRGISTKQREDEFLKAHESADS